MKIGIIVQARMTSKRLSGKVMLPINNTPLVDFLLNRLLPAKHFIIVATSEEPADLPIQDFAMRPWLIVHLMADRNLL